MTPKNDASGFPAQVDRRELFRIDDTAILEIQCIDADSDCSKAAEQCFDDSASFKLMRELRAIEQENSSLLRGINERYTDIAAYLQVLNLKFDAIGKAISEDILADGQKLQSIDLSRGGMGFNHSKKLEVGSRHAIKIWFHQTLVGLSVYIDVLACQTAIGGGFHISCEFYDLPEADEQVLGRHIMQVQAREQRNKKSIPD